MQLVFAEIVGWEFGLVLLIAALLFGSSKIPELARSLGKASSEFRKGVDGTDDNAAKAEHTDSSVANDNRDALASDLVKSEPAGAIEGAGTRAPAEAKPVDALSDAARTGAKAWRELQDIRGTLVGHIRDATNVIPTVSHGEPGNAPTVTDVNTVGGDAKE